MDENKAPQSVASAPPGDSATQAQNRAQRQRRPILRPNFERRA